MATSDRNAYDRTWFNGYAADGSYYFGIGMAVYPHRGILDCAFSVVQPDTRQHCFFGSRRAPKERTEMDVGPFRMEVIEPMKRVRVVLDDNASGVSCDLTFSARTAAIQEARQTLWSGTRRVMDATRFDQFGRWSGVVRHPDGEFKVEEAMCHGTKDRVLGRARRGRAGGRRRAGHAGRGLLPLGSAVLGRSHIARHLLRRSEGRGPGAGGHYRSAVPQRGGSAGRRRRPGPAYGHRPPPGQICARHAAGQIRRDRPGPARGRHPHHLDGPHPQVPDEGPGLRPSAMGPGYVEGRVEVGGESFDPRQLDMLAPENLHVQQVVRASDGQKTGIGVLEQICIGPYAPAGFTQFLDGAKG